MYFLWRRGESEAFERIAGNVALTDSTALDHQEFDYATVVESFPEESYRAQGWYEYQDAEAWVQRGFGKGDCWMYTVRIKFQNLESAIELYRLIVAGKIWPVCSAADQQVPRNFRHLGVLLRENFGALRRCLRRKQSRS